MRPNRLMAVAVAVVLGARAAAGQGAMQSFTFTANQAVPDGDWNGLALATNLSGMGGVISDLSVTLNLTGGYNGDLYAYLVHDSGFAVLLNRPGRSSSNDFGYADPGFSDLVLNDTAAGGDIHFYGGNGGLSLSGAYQPDGRIVHPVTTPAGGFDAAVRSAMLSSFQNLSPNGTWILYLADVSAGRQSTVVSWGLGFVDVPEPAAWGLALFVGAGLAVGRARWVRRMLERRW